MNTRLLAFAAVTFTLIFGLSAVAYGVLQALTVNVTVRNVPTAANIAITSPNPVIISINEGQSTTTTVTLHNSGETAGSVTLNIAISPTSPTLPAIFSNSLTTITLSIPANSDVNTIITIGPAPQVSQDASYTITVTGA